jgi:hypothetical protein
MADEYALTHKLNKENNGDGSVSNLNSYVQNKYPYYTQFDKPKSDS